MNAPSGIVGLGPRSIEQIIQNLGNRQQRRRIRAKVRHSAVERGDEEDFFRPITRHEVAAIKKAANDFEVRTKQKGCRNGKLGYTALRILDVLLKLIDYRTGRLEPSYLWIKSKTGLSISAIAEGLKRLADCGFLQIKRRYRKSEALAGPPVRQISNAYRFTYPKWLLVALQKARFVPLPDDEAFRLEQAEADHERMISQLPIWQQATVRADVVDPELKARLDRISPLLPDVRSAVSQCDSGPRGESIGNLYV